MITVRAAVPDDAPKLLAVYRPYVEKTAITFEWTVPSVEDFRERIRHTLEHFPYLIMLEEEKIIGYCYASPLNPREAYEHCAELSIYLAMDERGRGHGQALYQLLENILAAQGIYNACACIGYAPEEDEYLTNGSEHFHAHLGYRLVGRFEKCGYKFGRWYDMIWMEKHLQAHPEKPPRSKSFDEIRQQFSL